MSQAAGHAWQPSSPCGASCVEAQPAPVSTWRTAARIARLGAVAASFPLTQLLTPHHRREDRARDCARAVLASLGIELEVIDRRGADGTDFVPGTIFVAGHIGWTDVLALVAVSPAGFVARADLIDWPLLGVLARKMRVIPIDRNSLRGIVPVIEELAARVRAGERVAFFPEGTTWCGRGSGRFRPALFQAAIETGAHIQPVRITYLRGDGSPTAVPSFVGDDTFGASLLRIVQTKGLRVRVELGPAIAPAGDRRYLAMLTEQAVRPGGELDFAAHGVLDPAERNAAIGMPRRNVSVPARPRREFAI